MVKNNKLLVKTAWIVVWEWCGNHAKRDSKPLAFFNYRFNSRWIGRFIEQVYAASEYTPAENIAFLKYPKRNPYQAQYDIGVAWCGHNPVIVAKIVKNLRIENDNFFWDEIDREAIRAKHKRLIAGKQNKGEK